MEETTKFFDFDVFVCPFSYGHISLKSVNKSTEFSVTMEQSF